MAKIRIGDFGNLVRPVPDRGSVPAAAFGVPTRLGEAIQDAASVLGAGERERFAIERAEARQRAAELRRAKGVEAYAGFQADLDDFTASAITDLSEGRVKRDELPERFSKGLEDLKKRRLEGLDSEQQSLVGAQFITVEQTARRRLREAVVADEKRERVAALTSTGEELQRVGITDPGRAIKQWNMVLDSDGTAVLGADKVAAEKQRFAEGVWFSHFSNRLVAARQNGAALERLDAEIAGNQTIDPDKKNVLLGRVAGYKATLDAAAERAMASRLKGVERAIEANDRLIMAGFEPTPEQLAGTIEAAKGTPLEAAARAQVGFANQTAKFRSLPPIGQEQVLNQLEAAVRKGPTPENVKTLEAYRSIAQNQQALVKDDPISFAAQKGLGAVEPLNFSDLGGLPAQLTARLQVSRGMQAQYGAPLKVLTKQETAALSDFMRRRTPDEKVELLRVLHDAMPDPEAYQATMAQLAPGSPVTAWAGSLAGRRPFVEENLIRPDVQTQAATVARDIIAGESILNPAEGKSSFKMPNERDLRNGFEDAMGDAYRGREDAQEIAFNSARALYAKLSADEGAYTGEFDDNRWRRAVELATGGSAEFNGARVVLPYGMQEGEFKNAVFSELGKLAASGRVGLTQQQLSRLKLVNHQDSTYLVTNGSDYLFDKNGAPVVIDLMKRSVQAKGFTDPKGRPVSEQIPQ